MPRRKGNQNARRHGVYSLEALERTGGHLDGRSLAARHIKSTLAALASDRGYPSFADVPRALQMIFLRAAHKDLRCTLIESIPVEEQAATMREDYLKWASSLREDVKLIGTDRLARQVGPSLAEIRDAYTVEHEEKES